MTRSVLLSFVLYAFAGLLSTKGNNDDTEIEVPHKIVFDVGDYLTDYVRLGPTSGLCYRYLGDGPNMTRGSAAGQCAAEGARLASVKTREEMEGIKEMVSRCELVFRLFTSSSLPSVG